METQPQPFEFTKHFNHNRPTWPQVIAAAGKIAREKKAGA